jgi:hypothetical protein
LGKQKRNIPCEKCGYDPLRRTRHVATVELKFTWKSGNVINNPGSRSRFRYSEYKKRFEKLFQGHILDIPKASGFRRITLTRIYGVGPKGGTCYNYDKDNLSQGAKPLVDILKKYGIIIDDDSENAEIHYLQEESKDKYHYVRILIEDLD